MIQEPEIIDIWVREKVLGSGAFGIVTLWRNSATNEKIGTLEKLSVKEKILMLIIFCSY